MTYEQWCQHSTATLKEAEEYNAWRKRAKSFLLTKVGPRLDALGKTGYMGYGFHYSLEQTFGKLVHGLALPWQPSANHCDKVEDDRACGIVRKVIYKDLLVSIMRAEKSCKPK